MGSHRSGLSVAEEAARLARAAGTTDIPTKVQGCPADLYPIAVPAEFVATAHAGDVLSNVLGDADRGQRGWLTWTGDVGEPSLAHSLNPPGDSKTYVNPDDPDDHIVSVGDWVVGRPGVVNSHAVRAALDRLKTIDIALPVWDKVRPKDDARSMGHGSSGGRGLSVSDAQGAKHAASKAHHTTGHASHHNHDAFAYHVVGFVHVHITGYKLAPKAKISARFLGSASCEPPPANAAPTATDVVASTTQGSGATLTLTATDPDPDTHLTFDIVPPGHGHIASVGTPTCMAAASGGTVCSTSVIYTPAAEFVGTDHTTFTAFDGRARSDPASIDVSVEPAGEVTGGCPSLTALRANPSRWLRDITLTSRTGIADAGFVEDIPTGCDPLPVTLVSYAADYPDFANPLTERVVDAQTGVGRPLRVSLPSCLWQAYLIIGGADAVIPHFSPPDVTYSARRQLLASLDGGTDCEITTNNPPTANPATVSTAQGAAVAIRLTGSDPDGDALEYGIVSPPSHGTLRGTPPDLTYEPAPGYRGRDVFAFQVNDGRASSPPAETSIDVGGRNAPPQLRDDSATVAANGVLTPNRPQCTKWCAEVQGDPHALSFDRLDSAFQGAGEYAAVRSLDDDLTVQVRMTPVAGQRLVSIPTAVAMRVAGQRIGLYRTADGIDAKVDGQPLPLSAGDHPLPGGGMLTQYASDPVQTVVTWPDGSWLSVQAQGLYPQFNRIGITISLPAARSGRVQGLLGDADNDPRNDLTSRGGTQVDRDQPSYDALYHTFGDSWRISQADSVFDYAPGTSTETYTDRTFPDRIVTTDDLTPTQRAAAEAACATYGVTTAAAHRDCTLDVGLTGDPEFASGAIDEQKLLGGPAGDIGRLAPGRPDRIAFTAAGSAVRAIAATEGQRLAIDVKDNSVPDAQIVLRSPAGTVIGGGAVTSASAFFDPVTLGSTGTFTLEVQGGGPGALTVSVIPVPANEGATSLGALTPLTLATPGEVAVRTFSASAGERVGLDVSGNTIGTIGVSVLEPNGTVVLGGTLSGASRSFDPVTLPSTGTYSILIDPQGPATGAVNVLISSVPGNPGEVTIGQPTVVSIGTAGENATRTFSGSAGQLLTLDVTDDTIAAGDLSVTASDGHTVTGGFIAPPGRFFDTFALPSDGTYTVTIDPRDKNTGHLTFELNPVPANTGATTVGSPTVVSIGTAGENATRTFSGSAGQLLTLDVTDDTVAAGDLSVTASDGHTVTGGFIAPPGRFFDTFALPSDGTYTVTIDPRDKNTGHLTFELNPVPANTGATTVGSPTVVSIGTAGENATRTFSGSAGQLLTLDVTDDTIAAGDLSVTASDGHTVTGGFIAPPGRFFDTFALPSDGTYTVTIDPRDKNTGHLTFELNPVPANTGATTVGSPTVVSIGTAGENATRTFSGSAGQLLTLDVTDDTIAAGDLSVTASDGHTVTGGFIAPPGRFFDTFALPSDGTYTVTIDPRDKNTGHLTFELDRVPTSAAVAPPVSDTAGGRAATTSRLTVGRAVEVTLNAHRPRALAFSASSGSMVAVLIGRNTVRSVTLSLRAPDGTLVETRRVRGPTQFMDPVVLHTSGRYRLVLAPAARSGGHLSLLASRVPTDVRPLRLGAERTVELGAAGQTPTRRFTGHAGHRLRVHVRDSHLGPASILLHERTGRRLAVLRIRRTHDERPGAASLTTPPLPTTGAYEAVLDAEGPQTGTLRLSIRELAARHPRSSRAAHHLPSARVPNRPGSTRRSLSSGPSQRDRKRAPARGNRAAPQPSPATRHRSAITVPAPNAAAAPTARSAALLPQTGPLTQALPSATPAAATPRVHTLTLHDADLLANDAPGPPGESDQTLKITGVASTGATHGTLSRSDDGTITYVPEDGFTGVAVFTYQACDDGTTDGRPDPLCATATVSILVVPDEAPRLTDRHVVTEEDAPVDVALAVTDPEGDPVTVRMDRLPAAGTVSGTGPTFTYTPNADFHGADAFTVVASDGQAESEPATIGITVTEVNDPPRPSGDAVTARPGTPLTLNAADLLRNDAPGPGDEFDQTLSLTTVDATSDTHGTVSRAAGSMITYVADAAFAGTATFRYTACDDGTTAGRPDPRCADGAVTVHVAPDAAPTATPQTIGARQGRAAPVTLSGTDPEGQSLTFAVTSQPAHGRLSGIGPALAYTSDAGFTGTDSFAFTASDGTSTSAPAVVTLRVFGVSPPVTSPDAATVSPGSSVLIDVLANDTAGDAPLDPARLRIPQAPDKGTATVSDGQARYAPAAATTSGTDTFTYEACDADAACATGAVTVTIASDAAPETKPDTYEVAMGKDLAVDAPGVLGNDPGADGSVHAALDQGVHAGQLLLQGSGAFTYAPDPSFSGTDTFTYVAVGRTGRRSTPTQVSLKVSRGGLIAVDDQYTTQRDTPLTVAAPGVLANDEDTHAEHPELSATVVDRPQHGELDAAARRHARLRA